MVEKEGEPHMERPYYEALDAQTFEAIGDAMGPVGRMILACLVILAIIASFAITIIKGWDLIVVPWWRDILAGLAHGFGSDGYDTSER